MNAAPAASARLRAVQHSSDEFIKPMKFQYALTIQISCGIALDAVRMKPSFPLRTWQMPSRFLKKPVIATILP